MSTAHPACHRKHFDLPTAAKRKCNGGTSRKCEGMFMSEGPWNRICPRCSERNSMVAPRATGAHVGVARGSRRMLAE